MIEYRYTKDFDEKKNVEFYLKHGFEIMSEGTPLQIRGTSWE